MVEVELSIRCLRSNFRPLAVEHWRRTRKPCISTFTEHANELGFLIRDNPINLELLRRCELIFERSADSWLCKRTCSHVRCEA